MKMKPQGKPRFSFSRADNSWNELIDVSIKKPRMLSGKRGFDDRRPGCAKAIKTS